MSSYFDKSATSRSKGVPRGCPIVYFINGFNFLARNCEMSLSSSTILYCVKIMLEILDRLCFFLTTAIYEDKYFITQMCNFIGYVIWLYHKMSTIYTNLDIIRYISLRLDVLFIIRFMANNLNIKWKYIFFIRCTWRISLPPFSSSDCGHWIKIGWKHLLDVDWLLP